MLSSRRKPPRLVSPGPPPRSKRQPKQMFPSPGGTNKEREGSPPSSGSQRTGQSVYTPSQRSNIPHAPSSDTRQPREAPLLSRYIYIQNESHCIIFQTVSSIYNIDGQHTYVHFPDFLLGTSVRVTLLAYLSLCIQHEFSGEFGRRNRAACLSLLHLAIFSPSFCLQRHTFWIILCHVLRGLLLPLW